LTGQNTDFILNDQVLLKMQADIGTLKMNFFADIFGGEIPRFEAVDLEIKTIVGEDQSSLWVDSDSRKELFKLASDIKEKDMLQFPMAIQDLIMSAATSRKPTPEAKVKYVEELYEQNCQDDGSESVAGKSRDSIPSE